jgi:hypothetical protein
VTLKALWNKYHWPLIACLFFGLWVGTCSNSRHTAAIARQNAAGRDSAQTTVKLLSGQIEAQKAVLDLTAKQLKALSDSAGSLYANLQGEKQKNATVQYISQVQARTIDSLRGVTTVVTMRPVALGDSVHHGHLGWTVTDSGKQWRETVDGSTVLTVTTGKNSFEVAADSPATTIDVTTALIQSLQLQNGIYVQTIRAADPHITFSGLQGDAINSKIFPALSKRSSWSIRPGAGIFYVPNLGFQIGAGAFVTWDRVRIGL